VDADPGPILRRRQAGARLRQLREAAGASLDEVAAYLECSAAKVSRIETGRTTARVPDVRNLLDLYQVTGPEREEILDLVRESRQPGWWQAYADVLAEGADVFLGLEDAAASIRSYGSYLVPGLLQTRDYAHAVSAPRLDVTEEHIDRHIELRLTRQAIWRREAPPAAHFILDEAVLHRTAALGPAVGGPQLRHLTDAAAWPHLTLQVLPYAAGIGASGGIPFVLLGFPDPAEPPVAYLEQLFGSRIETKIDQVARYALAFEGLRSRALDPDDSTAMITDLVRHLRS
jgi:transcriptional regulator with XRE-family HTH domain